MRGHGQSVRRHPEAATGRVRWHHRRVPNSVTARDDEQERRPGAVLFVYTWDLALAILALFGALASFAGGVATSTGGTASLPLAVQIIAGGVGRVLCGDADHHRLAADQEAGLDPADADRNARHRDRARGHLGGGRRDRRATASMRPG